MAYQMTIQYPDRTGQTKITSLEELRRLFPGKENFFRNAVRYLVKLQDKSLAQYGTCTCESPMWDQIEAIMELISLEGIWLGIDTAFIAETFLVAACDGAVSAAV